MEVKRTINVCRWIKGTGSFSVRFDDPRPNGAKP